MPFGNFGSTLSDLARNQLQADSQLGQEIGNADQRTVQRQQLQQQGNQFLQDLALRRYQAEQQNALANAALAQQGRISDMQWNRPNATSLATSADNLTAAKLPWILGMTPAEQAKIAEEDKQLAILNRPYDLMQQGIPIGNGPTAQAAGQLMVDKAQRAEKMDGALKAANATYLANSPKDYWEWFGKMKNGSSQLRLANVVKQQLSTAMPEVNELLFDPSANHGQGGFVSPDQVQAHPQAPAANPLAIGAALLSSRTNAIPGVAAPPVAANQLSAALTPVAPVAAPMQPSAKIVVQFGQRYQVNPDGSGKWIGPAQ